MQLIMLKMIGCRYEKQTTFLTLNQTARNYNVSRNTYFTAVLRLYTQHPIIFV